MSALVQLTVDDWVRADTVLSVEVSPVDSERGYEVAVHAASGAEVTCYACGTFDRIELARERANFLVQSINDALREIPA